MGLLEGLLDVSSGGLGVEAASTPLKGPHGHAGS